MNLIKKILFVLCCFHFAANGQIESSAGVPILCNASSASVLDFQNVQSSNVLLSKTSVMSVSYTGFSSDQQKAFQAAVDVWASYLVSRVPIKITATFETLGSTTLASTNASKIFKNFSTLAVKDTWYPVALAEAISGTNLNDAEDEIVIKINKDFSWSTYTDGTRLAYNYDLMTIVLHELAHGLGFSSTFRTNSSNTNQATYGQLGLPYIYDLYVQNANSQLLTNANIFANPSVEMNTVLTTGNCWFSILNKAVVGANAKLYAPSTLAMGESISHFDEIYYAPGSGDALMTPLLNISEIIHQPGNLALAVLNQLGWTINNYDGTVITAIEPPKNYQKSYVFPNPAENDLSIKLADDFQNVRIKVSIYNSFGRPVFEKIDFNLNSIDVSDLFPAVYILKIQSSSREEFIKFVKI